MLSSINCWNDLDIFRARESYFTTLGIFTHHMDDEEKLSKRVDVQREDLDEEIK
jgi:hypothetical protein